MSDLILAEKFTAVQVVGLEGPPVGLPVDLLRTAADIGTSLGAVFGEKAVNFDIANGQVLVNDATRDQVEAVLKGSAIPASGYKVLP